MDQFKYICPISGEEINQAVILSDGFVYEKNIIEQYLKVPNLEFDVTYPQLTHSPYTGEKLISSIVKLYACVYKHNIQCSITRENVKVPYVIFSDKGTIYQIYEHSALIDYINNESDERKKRFYYNYSSSQFDGHNIIIVPVKSFMIMSGVLIGNHSPQIFALPQTKIPTCPKIYSEKIRKLFQSEKFSFTSLENKFIKNSIPIFKAGYSGNEIVMMNLDLSRMQITRGFKGCIFYNCNLSNSIISGGMSRCQFNYCNMHNIMIDHYLFIGEEVSFIGSNLDNAKICNNFRLEKGKTWQLCQNLDEICNEMLKRGAISVNKITLFDKN